MSENKSFKTNLVKINEIYMPMIENQLKENSITFGEYARTCVMNTISSLNNLLKMNGLTWNSEQLDQSNITELLLNVAMLELNPSAQPMECFFQLRNVKVDEKWLKKIEFGIASDGNDAILQRFGRNVEKVYPHWLVREDDVFEYPKYNGVEISAPKWEPRGTGEVVRVVYPILHTDKTMHFYIAEREDVAKNLLAHINNNLMNETFGFAKDRFKATQEELKKINARKTELKAKAKQLGLKALDDEELGKYISPAWKEDFSREEMIIRKMRNNVVKKIPKDFGSSFRNEIYATNTDDVYRSLKSEVIEGTATEVIDIEPIEESTQSVKLDTKSGEIVEVGISTSENENNAHEPQKSVNIEDRVKPSFE